MCFSTLLLYKSRGKAIASRLEAIATRLSRSQKESYLSQKGAAYFQNKLRLRTSPLDFSENCATRVEAIASRLAAIAISNH